MAVRNTFAGVSVVVVVAACERETSPPADTAAPAAAASAAWTSPVDSIPAAAIRGELANAAQWPEPPAAALRHCSGTLACNRDNNPSKVWVRVWAARGANNVGPGTVAPNTAVLIGKIENRGTDTTDLYKLAPNQVYAVYLMLDAAGRAKYEIWGVRDNQKIKAAEGVYTECGHPNRHRDRSFAVFANCSNSPESFADVTRTDSVLTFSRPVASTTHRDDPAWFTCTSGCCTADPQ